MKKKIVIDGRQLGKMMGGVQRYIVEMLNELDKIAPPEKYEILVPKGTEIENEYSNLKVVRYGNLNGLLWEQLCLPFYLWKNKVYGVFPCTIVPLLFPKGVVVLHDVMMARCPELGESFSNPIARKLLFMNYKIAAQRADVVITDAENSKTDIVDLYHRDPKKIYVIGAGWQHIQRVIENDDWMNKYPQIKEGEYYFSLSANRRQKNFKWIYEMAKKYPERIFAMAGTQEEWQREQEYSTPNIVHMGYISDGTIKSLMRHCKAFLFPSLYEGFGMPPLEALSVGAKIIVARTSCLPEIYQDSAYYIDPYDYDVDLDELLCQKVLPAGKVLDRFGWDISARRLDEICDKLLN